MRLRFYVFLLFCALSAARTNAQNKPKPSTDGKASMETVTTGGKAPTPPAAGADSGSADSSPPSVTGGVPTITDTATLSPPGWLEADFGPLKNLDRDRALGTPFLVKITSKKLGTGQTFRRIPAYLQKGRRNVRMESGASRPLQARP